LPKLVAKSSSVALSKDRLNRFWLHQDLNMVIQPNWQKWTQNKVSHYAKIC